MGWKEIAQNKWVPIVSVAFFIYGLPGMVDDFTAWKQWLGIMSPAWSGVLVGVGAGVFSLWLYAWLIDINKRKDKHTTNLWDSLNNIAASPHISPIHLLPSEI